MNVTNPVYTLLSPPEVADILGVRVTTLAVWRCCGRYPELRYVKIGRKVRYDRVDVEAFIASHKVGDPGRDTVAQASHAAQPE